MIVFLKISSIFPPEGEKTFPEKTFPEKNFSFLRPAQTKKEKIGTIFCPKGCLAVCDKKISSFPGPSGLSQSWVNSKILS
jgi:hypothetical protein